MEAAFGPATVRRTIGGSFSGRHNSLNLIRLVLATVVLVDHSVGLGGVVLWNFNQTSIGTIAVAGFFGISGFLIAGSAVRNGPWRYLWQRFLRIFPGLWVCLVVTAFVIGVIAYLHHPIAHCGLRCYFGARHGPFRYVYRNALLPSAKLHQFSIAGTPRDVPLPLQWDGSLWTLFYEFLCYLGLMALGLLGFLRRRVVTLAAFVVLWGAIFVITLHHSFDLSFNIVTHPLLMNLMKFAAVFMMGAVIYLYREVVPDSGWLALACATIFIVGLWLPDGVTSAGVRNPLFWFTASGLFTPLIAYPLLWLGIHLPFQKVGARNDYSYGVYIYSYPVAQLLAVFGLQRWGIGVFVALSVVATAPLAVLSWWLVERHALRLKRVALPGTRRPPASHPQDVYGPEALDVDSTPVAVVEGPRPVHPTVVPGAVEA